MSLNQELKYGSNKHAHVLEALRARVKLSEQKTSTLRQRMENDEKLYYAYMTPQDLAEASCRQPDNSKVKDGQDYKEIYVPYSYAILMTMHTYLTSVFLGRTPVMQYTGRHGESQQQVQVMEAMMDYQVQVGRMLPVMYNWLLDPGKYGFGVIGVYWETERLQVSRIIERPKEYLGVPIPGTKEKVRQTTVTKGYEGNKLYNIRPQDFIFDPRVPLFNFQTGEFSGRYVEIGWNNLTRGKESGRYYNIEEIAKKLKGKGSNSSWGGSAETDRDEGSSLTVLPDLQGPTPAPDIKSVDFAGMYEMVVELIPNDWGLGSSKYPEKWIFTFSLKHDVIIESRPYGYMHNKYPYVVLPYEIDAYSISPRSMLEITKPLNDVMTWLINTHFYSVRRVLNDQLIFDPSKVVLSDILDTSPGRLIRLKPEAYGTDPRLAVHQLQTTDSTQTHLKDIQIISEMLQRVTGVADNIMGMVNPGGRKTATEVRTSSSFGVNRLKTLAEYMSAVGFSPLSEMMVQNTQQFFAEERMFKVAGDLINARTSDMVMANPETIQGFFDFVPVDGTMPIDRFAQVTMWTQLMGMMQKDQRVMQEYDTSAIFSWIAKLGGLKNIDQFKIQVVPDEDLTGQINNGSLVPINGGQPNGTRQPGEASATGQGQSPQNATGVPGASGNGGMGPAG